MQTFERNYRKQQNRQPAFSYADSNRFLKGRFEQGGMEEPGAGMSTSCRMIPFRSDNIIQFPMRNYSLNAIHEWELDNDNLITENTSFSYPVFLPCDPKDIRKAILLLHGLNERNWNKYLVWAQYLAEHTGNAVILFPFAFHINRSPKDWANPRAMTRLMDIRKQRFGESAMSTCVNAALSERLTTDPLRFYSSGVQSANDLLTLCRQLKSGQHPLLPEVRSFDFFAYSIGAFLGQIMFLANPDRILDDSRLFLFCGGALFSQMNGVSRLIMDQQAFNTLYRFYLHDLPHEEKNLPELAESLNHTELGLGFKAMLAEHSLQSFRQERYKALKESIVAFTIRNDHVIPAEAVKSLLTEFIPVKILDFPEQANHENPFPTSPADISPRVDRCFQDVFSKAVDFFNGR